MSTPTFLARSLAALLRLGASFTARMPWSVQPRDMMNIGMESSCGNASRHAAPRARRHLLMQGRQESRRRFFERSYLPTALSLPVGPSGNLGTFRIKGSLRINYTVRRADR